MRRRVLLSIACLGFVCGVGLCAPRGLCAGSVSIAELIARAPEFEGAVVTIEGEAVGELLHRKDGVWVNVSARDSAIGAWLAPSATPSILQHLGNYKTRGDWVRITGVFHSQCEAHGGDIDIHAQELTLVFPGGLRPELISIVKIKLAQQLAGIVCIVMILQILRVGRRKISRS
jgi:hypothetical protein